jgi:16S rRNA (guanine966-N2)-methyltransferase
MLKPDTKIIVEASVETNFDYVEELGFEIVKYKKYKTNAHVFLKRK